MNKGYIKHLSSLEEKLQQESRKTHLKRLRWEITHYNEKITPQTPSAEMTSVSQNQPSSTASAKLAELEMELRPPRELIPEEIKSSSNPPPSLKKLQKTTWVHFKVKSPNEVLVYRVKDGQVQVNKDDKWKKLKFIEILRWCCSTEKNRFCVEWRKEVLYWYF